MFEIWATLSKNDNSKNDRLNRYMTHVFKSEDEMRFIPQSYELWKDELFNMDHAVLTFRYFKSHNSPYVTLNQLNKALKDFKEFKEKILISLSPMATDYNLDNDVCIPLTLNQAILKANIKSLPIYFSEEIGASYFTYSKNQSHLVWIEDTKSLALKHNLIKESGYRGIYWENPYSLLEGNWEALSEVWKKRTSR